LGISHWTRVSSSLDPFRGSRDAASVIECLW
jgi:hypothetical protein